jgi:methionine aminopeptidase
VAWYRKISVKTPEEIEIMRIAGRINAEALQAAYNIIRPGVTTADLNAAAEEVLKLSALTRSWFTEYRVSANCAVEISSPSIVVLFTKASWVTRLFLLQ